MFKCISPEFLLFVAVSELLLAFVTLAILLCASQVSCGISSSLGMSDVFSHESAGGEGLSEHSI